MDRKKLLIQRYYRENKTLQEIGDELGISRERVRQLMEKYGFPRDTKRSNKSKHQEKDLTDDLTSKK